jgi:hypothetical protein
MFLISSALVLALGLLLLLALPPPAADGAAAAAAAAAAVGAADCSHGASAAAYLHADEAGAYSRPPPHGHDKAHRQAMQMAAGEGPGIPPTCGSPAAAA